MIRAPKTEARIILDHFDGSWTDRSGRTVSDISTSSGGRRSWAVQSGNPITTWTFGDGSTIQIDLDTHDAWEVQRGKEEA